MKYEEIGSDSSFEYSVEVLHNCFSLTAKIKDLQTLLNNPSYQKEIRAIESDVKKGLRRDILDNLFYICQYLNRPEILHDVMIRLYVAPRYGWSARGLDYQDIGKSQK